MYVTSTNYCPTRFSSRIFAYLCVTQWHVWLRQHLYNVAEFGHEEIWRIIVLSFGHQLAYVVQVMDAGSHEKSLHASSTAHHDVRV